MYEQRRAQGFYYVSKELNCLMTLLNTSTFKALMGGDSAFSKSAKNGIINIKQISNLNCRNMQYFIYHHPNSSDIRCNCVRDVTLQIVSVVRDGGLSSDPG